MKKITLENTQTCYVQIIKIEETFPFIQTYYSVNLTITIHQPKYIRYITKLLGGFKNNRIE